MFLSVGSSLVNIQYVEITYKTINIIEETTKRGDEKVLQREYNEDS